MGRPTKYRKEFAEQAYQMCLLGATDETLANFFEVNEDTVNSWKKKPDFSESLRRGKIEADAHVAAALHKRAMGFTYEEITYEKIVFDGGTMEETEIKLDAWKKKVVTKTVVPDTGACVLWLKNRQKDLWRDKQEIDFSKMTDEQLSFLVDQIMTRIKK